MDLKSVKTTNANLIMQLEKEHEIKLEFEEGEHEYKCLISNETKDEVGRESGSIIMVDVMTMEEYRDKTIRQEKMREFLIETIYEWI